MYLCLEKSVYLAHDCGIVDQPGRTHQERIDRRSGIRLLILRTVQALRTGGSLELGTSLYKKCGKHSSRLDLVTAQSSNESVW